MMNDRNSSLKRYDIAYGSFLFCGVVILLAAITSLIPMNSGIAGGIGFLVLIPLSIAAIAALFIGLWLTVVLKKQMPLNLLAVMSVLFVVEIMTEFGSPSFYNSVNWIYGSIAILFPLRWFFIKRDDYKKIT